MGNTSRGSSRTKRVYSMAVSLLTLLLAGFLVPGAAARSASNAVTFTDPTGDSGGAADITTVDVSNDDNGAITLKVSLPNRATAEQLSDILVIAINNDPNASNNRGAYPFVLFVFSQGVQVMRFDGSRFVPFDAPSLRATYSSGPTITFDRADFGISTRLAFFAQIRDQNAKVRDDAPDSSAAYTYVVTIGPPPLATGPVSAVPTVPVHGKAFSLRLPVTRTDSNTALPDVGVTVRCTGRVGKKAISGRDSYNGGVATCTFRVPKTSRGKALKAMLTLGYQGATISRSFSSRIR
jgi:hypothetical protein